MKSFLCIVVLYLCLSMLVVSCSDAGNEPEPACMEAEVIGPDNCQNGGYILKLKEESSLSGSKSNHYVGQLHGGYVTARNLPEEYRQAGKKLTLTLELDEEPTQVCPAIYVIYPAVRVVRVCAQANEPV